MKNNNKLLACPYIIWMILFTIIPLGIVFYYALTDSITGQFTLANLSGREPICRSSCARSG